MQVDPCPGHTDPSSSSSSSSSSGSGKTVDYTLDVPVYRWSVYEVTPRGIVHQSDIKSLTEDPSRFYIKPYTLKALTTYLVHVSVSLDSADTSVPRSSSMSRSRLARSTSTQVIVGTSATVVAIITGGRSVVATTNRPIILDASSSFDRDYPLDKKLLTFTWGCSILEPAALFGESCMGMQIPMPAADLENRVNGSTFKFLGSSTRVSRQYC